MSTESFDYVIVGAGAAGAILANRLSADGSTVCLLEAGPSDWHPFLHIPAGFIKVVFNPTYAWQFTTEPTELTAGRRIPIPQGRVLGGSSSINGLVYNRGQQSDYDHWADLGNPGWAFREVLPYFKSMERHSGGSDEYRGRSGELPVSNMDWIHPLCEAFIQGAAQQGMPRTADYNGESQEGAGYFQRTIDRGWRMSTAHCFLRPVRRRPNLTIRTSAQAARIIIEDRKARGVQYNHPSGGPARTVLAAKSVIVACGAINTPKLLMLSGLGPAAHLQETGVPVVRDLAGVGQNLSDHYSVRLVARVKGCDTLNELSRGLRLGRQIFNWATKKPSIMALSPSLVHWFWKSEPGLDRADLQGVFTPASYKEGYVGRLDDYPGMTVGVWQHRPRSRGHVRLQSPDAAAAPLVQPNYLSDSDDQRVLINGVRLARELLRSKALERYFDGETLPGDLCRSEDELLDFVRHVGVSSYHLNGTARMGPASDPMAVVDARLKVHGIDHLRVVDSSVMPSIPSANICAATMMIANKAADMILDD